MAPDYMTDKDTDGNPLHLTSLDFYSFYYLLFVEHI